MTVTKYQLKKGVCFFKPYGAIHRMIILAVWEDKEVVLVERYDCEGGWHDNAMFSFEQFLNKLELSQFTIQKI